MIGSCTELLSCTTVYRWGCNAAINHLVTRVLLEQYAQAKLTAKLPGLEDWARPRWDCSQAQPMHCYERVAEDRTALSADTISPLAVATPSVMLVWLVMLTTCDQCTPPKVMKTCRTGPHIMDPSSLAVHTHASLVPSDKVWLQNTICILVHSQSRHGAQFWQ